MEYDENEWKSIYHDEKAAQQAADNGNTATATDEPVTRFEKDPVTGEITFKKMMGDTVTDELTLPQESLTAPVEQQERAAFKPSAGLHGDSAMFLAAFGDLDEVVCEPFSIETSVGNFACMIELLSSNEAMKLTSKAWRGPGGKILEGAQFTAHAAKNTAILTVQRCVVRLAEKDGVEVTEPIFSMQQVTQMYEKAKLRPLFEALYEAVSRVNRAGVVSNLNTPQSSDL